MKYYSRYLLSLINLLLVFQRKTTVALAKNNYYYIIRDCLDCLEQSQKPCTKKYQVIRAYGRNFCYFVI